MALPTITRTWTISPNNRIQYVSLNDTMARYLFGIKQFLVAGGYTVRGSSDGSAGAMDLTDRWITFANVTTRGASAAAPQSWIVLRDGNGVDILLAYQGASDDVCRISFSPGQLFAAAVTPTHQPTAADEQLVKAAATAIGVSATIDRIWFGWRSSDNKACRFAIARNNAWLGFQWGIEDFTHALVAPAVISPPVWGFALQTGTSYVRTSTQAGVSRVVISGTPYSCTAILAIETFADSAIFASTIKPELQGAYLVHPISVGSSTSGARGKLGNLIDHWTGRSDAEHGVTYGLLQFLSVGNYVFTGGSSGLWPWDGATTPVLF